MATEMPECCKPKKKTGWIGIVYGIIPHAGCIAFILASILGMTFAASLFKPLLMKGYLFYAMIALSFVFASISALIYMKGLSIGKIKANKNYLLILYGGTIITSLIIYFVVFPMVANVSISGNAVKPSESGLSVLTLNVNIPCSGHAPLIIGEVEKLDGIGDVQYKNGNFAVSYDSGKVTKQDILNLEIFKEYKAKEV